MFYPFDPSYLQSNLTFFSDMWRIKCRLDHLGTIRSHLCWPRLFATLVWTDKFTKLKTYLALLFWFCILKTKKTLWILFILIAIAKFSFVDCMFVTTLVSTIGQFQYISAISCQVLGFEILNAILTLIILVNIGAKVLILCWDEEDEEERVLEQK